MLNRLITAGAAAVLGLSSLALTSSAFAAGPMALPAGPLYIKFDNREQIAIAGDTGFANEINWGVLQVSSINVGNITGQNVIESTGAPIFSNISSHNAQITGIFYGIEQAPSGTSPFPSTNGRLDLYWRDLDAFATSDISTVLPGVRTSQSTATGYTDGILLASLEFASGITVDPAEFISGSIVPTPGTGFAGLATSYANVDTSVAGLWTNKLDGDWFQTAFGTRDFRFRNIYEELIPWTDPNNPNIVGARSTDPATTFVVPVPAPLMLMGLALVGIAVSRRRMAA